MGIFTFVGNKEKEPNKDRLINSITASPILSANQQHISTKKTNKPKININIITNYYNIHGITENELRQQMNTLGPLKSNSRHDAYTKWDIEWFKRCNEPPSVKIIVVFTYPKWNKPNNLDSVLESKWSKYIEALKIHENGHRDIAVRTSEEIMDTLYNLPYTNNCNNQNKQVIDLGNKIIEKYRQKEIEYDKLTNHGMTQGAIFP